MLHILFLFILINLVQGQEDFTVPADSQLDEGFPEPRQDCLPLLNTLEACLQDFQLVACGLCLTAKSIAIVGLEFEECNDFGDWICGALDGCTACGGCADEG